LAFRRPLTPSQRHAFDELGGLLDQPRHDLGWYHAVGGLVNQLLPPEQRDRGYVVWLEEPAKALGTSTAFLQKPLRFFRDYPRAEEVHRLEEEGVEWTRLYTAFPVRDLRQRHRLLREAVRGGWSVQKLTAEIRQLQPSRRRGVGCRPRRKPEALDPEAALRRLDGLSQGWLDFFDHAWSRVTEREWKELVRKCPPEDRAKLRQLIGDTKDRVERLVAFGREAMGRVGWLVNLVGND
jgi:hypothetical protein